MTHPWDIVPLAEAQVETAGSIMNRAFVDEPIGQYMYPDPQERHRLLRGTSALIRTAVTEGHRSPEGERSSGR